MRGNDAFVPREYDVFTGLDVSKKSMSVTWAGCLKAVHKLSRWSKRSRRKATGEPSTKHAVKLSAQCPALPSSPLRSTDCDCFPSDC
jgi:hypothetical protein